MEATTAARILSSNPELDLVERHRYGDRRAFDELYERFATMVYNLAYRLSGKPEDAEDLTQEIFVRIYRHLGRFDGRSTLKTWIYRVAVNHCRSCLGRRRRWTRPLADEAAQGGIRLTDPRRSPEERALAADAARRVAAGLRRLKPPFREAVVLRDLEGLSYDEIATVLGVRIGTVRSRIARGRDQLRAVLEEEA